MLERGLMADSVLDFITNSFKVLTFEVYIVAVLQWLESGFKEGRIELLKYLFEYVFNQKDTKSLTAA